MNAVLITEHYRNETTCSSLVKYDMLPLNIKAYVDKALKSKDKKIVVEESMGLQFLYNSTYYNEEQKTYPGCIYSPDYFFVQSGEKTEFLGEVTFYDND